MGENSFAHRKYMYFHDQKYPHEAIDIHHIEVQSNAAKRVFLSLLGAIVVGNALYLVLTKEKSVTLLFSSFLLWAFLRKLLLGKPVKKESVVIMPTLGIQLETLYISGRITRQFVPVSKILKPVLQECVTPVTCYWSLSLVLREEEELTPVFKELRPPLKMLIPVWKALCAATGEGSSHSRTEDSGDAEEGVRSETNP